MQGYENVIRMHLSVFLLERGGGGGGVKCGSRGGTGGPDPLENHKLYGFL